MSASAPPVGVAIIDSGVNVPHPHLASVAGGIAITHRGIEHTDYVDRLGHGTAVASAIHEKAPEAELYAVRVFESTLATSVPTLVRAIDWAVEREIKVVNLSLGTPNRAHIDQLVGVVERAAEKGTIIVSAREYEDRLWYPGCLPGVVGVFLDWDHPRESVSAEHLEGEAVAVCASGYPRPISGVPPERNLSGISFAVANTTGVLAATLRSRPSVRSAEEAVALIETLGMADPGT